VCLSGTNHSRSRAKSQWLTAIVSADIFGYSQSAFRPENCRTRQTQVSRASGKTDLPIEIEGGRFCYLDSIDTAVTVLTMRTTITIDADTEALLRQEVQRTGLSFKMVLNQAIKRALGRRPSGVQLQPLFSAPFPPELTRQSFNRLAAEWEDEDTILELGS